MLSLILNNNFDNIENINLNSESTFSFHLNRKFKISNLNLKSNITLNSLKYNYKLPELKKFLPNFNNIIELNKHAINLKLYKNQATINGKGAFSINNDNEFIEYSLEKKEKNFLFKSKVKIKNNPILIKFIDYKKESKINSEINFEGFINKDQSIYLKSLSFSENKNQFFIEDLDLSKNFKINSIKKFSLDFLNNKKIQNTIKLKKNKKKYEIKGKNI